MGFFSKMVNSALVNVAKATNPPGGNHGARRMGNVSMRRAPEAPGG